MSHGFVIPTPPPPLHRARSYLYWYCSPSRSALQSGRNPIHVNANNDGMFLANPVEPTTGGYSGIPRNMTCALPCVQPDKDFHTPLTPNPAHTRTSPRYWQQDDRGRV